MSREAERAKATRRSEQQERARKQAAASLMRKRGGWMASFGTYMEAALSGVARSVDASMDEDQTVPKVILEALCRLQGRGPLSAAGVLIVYPSP